MKNLLIINATLTLKGPLSIKMPVAEGGRDNAYGNFPVMATSFVEGEPVMSGYLPATTVRGHLRRSVVLRGMEAAAAAGAPFSLKRAYTELIGQDADSEKSVDEVDLVAVKAARESSPVLDLFGSGLGVKSRLRVSNFTPEVAVLPTAYCFPRKDLSDTDGVLDLVPADEATAFANRATTNSRRAAADNLATDLKRKLKKAEKAGEAQAVADLKAQLAAAEEAAAKLKGEMGEMANSSRTLVGFHALPAGLVLNGRIIVENWKERDIEMLTQALDVLSQDPTLGAQRARGCGEVEGTFDFVVGGQLVQRVLVGGYAPARVVKAAMAVAAE